MDHSLEESDPRLPAPSASIQAANAADQAQVSDRSGQGRVSHERNGAGDQ